MQEKLEQEIAKGSMAGLHSVVVMLRGEPIAEAYATSADECLGTRLGSVEHGPETLHDTRSITKSVVGLLYGIALSEGAVPDLDTSLLVQFPEYTELQDGTDRERITVRDALTLQMGTEWNEDWPYSDPRNSEIAMEMAADRYRFALNRPMVTEPGRAWSYNGGAVALIAKLITDGTDLSIDEYARRRLLEPLGVRSFEWVKGADGVPLAASGLRMTAPDLAKLGTMVAQGGFYDKQQIVPPDWLDASFVPAAKVRSGIRYGYLWYLTKGPAGDQIIFATGNGGQRLTIQPRTGFVVSTFAGLYNNPLAWRLSLKVLEDFAVPEAASVLARSGSRFGN